MSLARRGWDGSDVYVYQTFAGDYVCTCSNTESFRGNARAMGEHLRSHVAAGWGVPESAFDRLADDAAWASREAPVAR